MSDLILGSVIAVADAIGRGAWDWWIVAVMVLVVARRVLGETQR